MRVVVLSGFALRSSPNQGPLGVKFLSDSSKRSDHRSASVAVFLVGFVPAQVGLGGVLSTDVVLGTLWSSRMSVPGTRMEILEDQ